MKKVIHNLIVLVLILGMGACDFSISSGEDGISFGKIDMRPGFKATDQKQMEVLMQKLDSAGVKYSLGNDGFVRYSPKDKDKFKNIQAMAEAMVSARRVFGPQAGSVDLEYLDALKKELDSAGVKYSVDDESIVRFLDGNEQKFKSILLKIHKRYHLGDATSFRDERRKKRLVSLLKEEGVEHVVLTQKNGVMIRWYSDDDGQRKRIWNKINALDGRKDRTWDKLHGWDCSRKRKDKTTDSKTSKPSVSSKLTPKKDVNKPCAS